MALAIRLTRGGAKKRPYYRIVVADARAPRDGRFIEKIGTYNPLLAKDSPERVKLDGERIKHWLSVGAQPTDRVSRFLDSAGNKERAARTNPNKAEPGEKAMERAGAHGIHGEVRLQLFAESGDSLARNRALFVGGRELTLESVRDGGATAIARFAGIADRSAAEALRGSLVEIDRSALPPLEAGEYYHADVIGLPAVDRDGKAVGTVVSVENYGAGDLLEIEAESGKRSLIPFRENIADLHDDR